MAVGDYWFFTCNVNRLHSVLIIAEASEEELNHKIATAFPMCSRRVITRLHNFINTK